MEHGGTKITCSGSPQYKLSEQRTLNSLPQWSSQGPHSTYSIISRPSTPLQGPLERARWRCPISPIPIFIHNVGPCKAPALPPLPIAQGWEPPTHWTPWWILKSSQTWSWGQRGYTTICLSTVTWPRKTSCLYKRWSRPRQANTGTCLQGWYAHGKV